MANDIMPFFPISSLWSESENVMLQVDPKFFHKMTGLKRGPRMTEADSSLDPPLQ